MANDILDEAYGSGSASTGDVMDLLKQAYSRPPPTPPSYRSHDVEKMETSPSEGLPSFSPIPRQAAEPLKNPHEVHRPEWAEQVGAGAGFAPIQTGHDLAEMAGQFKDAIHAGDWEQVSKLSPYVLGMAAMGKAKPRGAPEAPWVSKMEPAPASEPSGLFSMKNLERPPADVAQEPIPRYEPPRGVSDRAADLINNAAVKKQVEAVVDRGLMKGGPRWYGGTEQLRNAFVDILGDLKGEAAFQDYMNYVSGSSVRSRVQPNQRNASYYYVLDRQGKDIAENKPGKGSGYGHLAADQHTANAAHYQQEGYIDPIAHPKLASFGGGSEGVEGGDYRGNLQGNWLPVTIDKHATSLPAILARDPRWLETNLRQKQPGGGYVNLKPRQMYESGEMSMDQAVDRPAFWAGKPKDNEYKALEENFWQPMGKKKGIPGAGVQASGWVGGGDITDLGSDTMPWLHNFGQVLAETAQKRGQTPQQVLEDFVKGKKPL